jgi:hypothetical protein
VVATGLDPVSQSGQEDENCPPFLRHPKSGDSEENRIVS